ncbi:MAG: hypothetical protein WD851_02080 [Pirellulales bacterium]
MTAKRNNPRLQAEPAYENAHLIARDQLKRIEELLFDLPAPGNDEYPINWAHVGTLSAVNSQLSDIVRFLESGNH